MADACPGCGEKEIATFVVGKKEVNFLARLTLGAHHGPLAGAITEQVCCANCHIVYMREVKP